MTQINRLGFTDELSNSDSVPIYDESNGSARRTSLAALSEFVAERVTPVVPLGSLDNILLGSMGGLVGLVPSSGQSIRAIVDSFYSGWTTSNYGASGAGVFVWNPTALKSKHDGVFYISPTVPWDGSASGVLNWQNKVGETDVAGSGCWKRVTDGRTAYLTWWGAVPYDVSIDSSNAFDKAWAHIRSSREQPAANIFYVVQSLVVPTGKYLVNHSVNWTNLLAWNVHVDMSGAVIYAGSGCAERAVFDCTNVRGLHIKGGTIVSTQAIDDSPMCGLFVGNLGTNTCGNNSFTDLKIFGSFTYAAAVNIGSETTPWINCYFAQTATNVTGVRRYGYVADNMHTDTRVVSDYTALRTNGVAVSFTDDTFRACHFRNYANGDSIFCSGGLHNWEFDPGCYFLAFDSANIRFRIDPVYRPTMVTFGGTYETNQLTGVLYAVNFIVENGTTCAFDSFKLRSTGPMNSVAVINCENSSGGITTGTLKLPICDIQITSITTGATMFNSCGTVTVLGNISTRSSSQLNIKDLAGFRGNVYVQDLLALDTTGMSSKPISFTAIDESGSGYTFGDFEFSNDVQVGGRISSNGIKTSYMGFNGWLTISSVPSGLLSAGARSLLQLDLVAPSTITDISDTVADGVPLITVRVLNQSATFVNNVDKIRLNGGVNKTISLGESISFIRVASGVYQEIAGKAPHIFKDSTGIGYGSGSGGTVTQSTSKTTNVTLNKPSGRVTMNNAALAAGASVTFYILNSSVAEGDTANLNFDGFLAAWNTNYSIRWATYPGFIGVTLTNVSAGSLSEAVQIYFNVIKGSTT